MPGFLNEINNVTMANITSLTNNSDLGGFAVNINNVVYGGWLFFILLWLIGIISFMAMQQREQSRDQPLINLIYSFTFVSILSFMLRGVYIIKDGVRQGLLTDHLLWVFPIIVLVFVFVAWATKKD